MVKADGSVEKAYKHFYLHGARAFKEAWPFPSGRACKLVGAFVAFEAFLQILLPGERFLGPSTPAGNRPLYTVSSFFLRPYLSCFTTNATRGPAVLRIYVHEPKRKGCITDICSNQEEGRLLKVTMPSVAALWPYSSSSVLGCRKMEFPAF